MAKKCEVKPYINKLSITDDHKNYLNNLHNAIYDELLLTKAFTVKDGNLYALKDNYVKSQKAINAINLKYGNVAALLNDKYQGKRLVNINTIILGTDFPIQQATREAEKMLREDAERVGAIYTERYMFDDDLNPSSDEFEIISNAFYIPNVDYYFIQGLTNAIFGDIMNGISDPKNTLGHDQVIKLNLLNYFNEFKNRFIKIQQDIKQISAENIDDYIQSGENSNVIHIFANWKQVEAIVFAKLNKINQSENKSQVELDYENSLEEAEETITENEISEDITEDTSSDIELHNEDRADLLNPKDKISIKEKIFLSSIPTGRKVIAGISNEYNSPLFNEYYSLDNILPQLINLLSLSSDNYYELSYDSVKEIIAKSNYKWKDTLIEKLDNAGKEFQTEFISSKYTVKANYEQVLVDDGVVKILSTNNNSAINLLRSELINNFPQEYVLVNDSGIVSLQPDFLLVFKDITNKNILISDSTNVKTNFLNFLSLLNFDKLLNVSIEDFPEEFFTTRNVKIRYTENGRTQTGYLSLAEYFNRYKINYFNNINKSISENTFNVGELYNDNIVNIILSHVVKLKNYADPIMNKDGNKSTSNFTTPRRFYNRIIEFINNPDYFKTFYSESGDWLKNIELLNYFTLALQPHRDASKKRFQNPDISKYNDPDHEHVKAMFFFGNNEGSKGLKFAKYFANTYSDKKKITGISYIRRDFGLLLFDDNLTDIIANPTPNQENLINLLYSQLIQPDVNRIINEDLSDKLATYNKNIFYSIPTITTSDVGLAFQKLVLSENVTKEQLSEFFNNPDNVQAMKLIMLEYLKEEIINTKEYWNNINFGVVPNIEKPGKFDISNLSQSVYNDYNKKFSGLSGSDLQFVLASDYVLNYAIHYANMNMFVAGDPAQFAKGKFNLHAILANANAKTTFINSFNKFYEGITTNITKRLAKLSSPSRLTKYKYDNVRYLVVSDNESRAIGIRYIVEILDKEHITNNLSNFITKRKLPLDTTIDTLITDVIKDFDDFISNGSPISELEDYLQEYFPSSAAYFNVTHADAQEFVHWEHHLDYLLGLGKINEAEYERLYNAIESNTQLNSADLKTLFSGIKPLYSGEMKVDGSMVEYYIKSSHIPLIPSIVKGKPIEEIYNIMNQRVKVDNTKTRPFIDRLTFKSAVKVGLPKSIPTLYKMSGDQGAVLNEKLDITEETILKLNSKYLGDQVEVPVKSKNKVTDATQFKKLLSSNIQNEPIELKNQSLKDLMNNSIATVKDLIQKRNNLYRDLYLMDREKLLSRIIINGKLNYNELFNVLKEEMAARNYSPNERAFIDLIGEGNEQTFVLPLYLTTNPKKYDALISSLIDKAGVTSTKRNGYAFVQASDLGFSGGTMTSKLSEYQGIIYTSKYKKTGRNTLEYTSYEGNNIMEIIIPWRFKEVIDLFLDEDGNIDSTKLPAELLRGIGYRIPNQAHSSMRAFKIVGFLPEKYGNVAIVPSAVTKQMGSDFDIDKLYSYLPAFAANISDEEMKAILQEPAGYGKLLNGIKYELKKDKRSELENKIFDIEYEILASTNEFIQKAQLQPLDNSMGELKKIVNLINSNIKFNSSEQKQLKSIVLPSYQREKFISGTSGKSGVGWFSLLLTFNSLVQNQDISASKENFIPLTIQIFDQGERLVTKQAALPSISHQFDLNTINELKAYYNRIDAEGKQLVYDKELDDYKLLDFKNIKDINAITSEFSDKLGIDTIVVPQDEMDRIIQTDPSLYNTITDINDKVLLAYNGNGLIVSEDSRPEDSLKFYTSEIISDLEVLSSTSPEAKEVFDNLFNSAIDYLEIRENTNDNTDNNSDDVPFSLEEINKTQLITDAIVDLIENKQKRKGAKGFFQALREFIEYIRSILHTKLAEKLITNKVITASDLTAKSDIGKLISLNDLANIIAVSDNKINSKERLKTQIEYKLTEDELANLNNLRSNYSVAKELIEQEIKQSLKNNPKDYTNHSGGAVGSDSYWHIIGKKFGIEKQNHYREPASERNDQPIGWVDSEKLRTIGVKSVDLEEDTFPGVYKEGQIKATTAARQMGRIEPTHQSRSAYIIRNWAQVKYSDAVYALGTIVQAGFDLGKGKIAKIPQVKGGTGYAVQMAINENKPVYIYDGTKDSWFTYDYDVKNFVKTDIPILTKNYAGIGSRSLSTEEVWNKSIKAIYDVFNKTFPQVQLDSVNNESINLSTNISVEKLTEDFSRTSVQNDTDYIYLFTDNANRTSGSNLVDPNSWYAQKYGITSKYPTKTQAVIRGLNNAFPITTMIDQNKTQWSDDNFDEYVKLIDSEINDIKDALNTNKYKGIKYSGTFGDGTYSKIKDNAPKIWEYLNNKLLQIGINNNFKPTESSKDNTKAIRDLFDNDIKLANSVYEALGFTGKLKVSLGKELEYKDPYAENRIKDFKKYEVLDNSGKNIGTVVIEDRGNKTVILHPELSVIGKGYGKDLYKTISSKLGVTIQEWTDGTVSKSDSAKAMWDSLEKEGSAIRIINEEDGDNFRQLNYKSELTPQQKQQAIEVYSNYLATIFPDSKVKDIVYHGTNLNFDKFDKDRIGSNTAVKGEKPSFSFSNNRKQAEAYSSEITVGQNTNELAGVWFEENQHIFKNGDITTGVIDENNVIEHYKKELENSKEMISPTGEIDPLTNKYKLIPVNNKTLKQLAEIKTKEWQKEYNTLLTVGPKVMSVIIDVKNPKIVDFKGEKKSIKFKEEQKNTIGDAFIAKNIDDWGKGDVIQVFEPEQIHILGSKQDIEGFKKFITKDEQPDEIPAGTPVIINGIPTVVPENSNPTNTVIFEKDGVRYLMNDGQEKAYQNIKNKINSLLAANTKINSPIDFKETVLFENPLAKKYSSVFPEIYYNKAIGLLGRGGVGKTTIIKKIIEDVIKDYSINKNKYQPSLSVKYITPTHNAATELQLALELNSETTKGDVSTIQSLTGRLPKPNTSRYVPNYPDIDKNEEFPLMSKEQYFKQIEFGKAPISSFDILVFDESSMLSEAGLKGLFKRLEEEHDALNIRKIPIMIFMGDYRQLGPVNEQQNASTNKGVVSSTVFTDGNKTEELTQVMRSQNKALHEIFDTIGSQIVENMKQFRDTGTNIKYDFTKYNEATNKSSENVLVVNDVQGVIDDYTNYLSTNDNPNGMFWVHYNNINHPDTKDLYKKIRQSYFKKLIANEYIEKDADVNNIKHRTFYKGDYIEYTGGMEMKTIPFKIPKDQFVSSKYSQYASKLKAEEDQFVIKEGVIKPNARFKILDIFEQETSLGAINSTLGSMFQSYDLKTKSEIVLLYNRQDNLRAIKYLKSLYIEIGQYNPATKTIELTLVDSEDGKIIKKVNTLYKNYKDNEALLLSYSKNRGIKASISPSYIGSSHTVQGSSIKNIIVGEYNIKGNLSKNVNPDDIMSSLYVGLTRTSGTLTLIKSPQIPIIDNQKDFKGFVYDSNNKLEDETNLKLEDEGLNPAALTDDQNSLRYDNNDSLELLEKKLIEANNKLISINNQNFTNRYNLLSDFSTPEHFLKNFSETYIKKFDPTFNIPLTNKSYHIVGYQSASVDNANEAILDDGHLNDSTFKFAKPALMYGFDKLAIQSVLQLPILKDYFKELSYSRSLGSSYQANLEEIILRKLANKYLSNNDSPLTDSAYQTIIANLMKLKASNPKEFYNWKINPANIDTPVSKQDQFKILLGYFDFVSNNEILDRYMGLLNTDSKGGGGSILNILDRLSSIENIIQSNNNAFDNIDSLFYTAISAGNIDNLNYVFRLFNDPNISLVFRKDLLLQNLLNEYSTKFDLSQDDYKFKQSTAIFETAIKSVLFNKALYNTQKLTPHAKRLRLLISGNVVVNNQITNNNSLGDIINIIKRHDYLKLNLDPNSTRFKQLQTLSNSKFFTQLKVEEVKEYKPRKGEEFKQNKLHLLKYNQNISKNDLDNDSGSVDTELLNIYNDNFEIINGYTTVNLINDLLDYSIVTGAENSPTNFFNKIPAALVIMRYGEELRKLSNLPTINSNLDKKYELSLPLQEILFNNPELLPSASTSNVTVDKSGQFLTVKKDKVKDTPIFVFNDMIWIKDQVTPFRYNKTQKLTIGKSLKQYGDISNTRNILDATQTQLVYIKPEDMVPSGEAVLTNSVDVTNQTAFMRAINDTSNLQLSFNSFGFLEQMKLQIANNNSENTYALSDIINSFMSTTANIPVVFANLAPNQLGKYDTLKDKIILNNNLRLSENRNKLFNTFLHEMGHVATWRKLLQYQKVTGKDLGIKVDTSNLDFYTELSEDDQVIIDRLYNSYNTIKADLPHIATKYKYAFKNIGEFISEFIGNPAFRTELNIESSSNKTLREKIRTIYNSIVDLLKSFLFGTTSLDEIENPVMTSILQSILFLSKTTTSVRLVNDGSKRYDVELTDNNIYTATVKLNGSNLINPIEKILEIKDNPEQYIIENIETTTGIDFLSIPTDNVDPLLEDQDDNSTINDDETTEDVSEKAYKDYVLPLTKGELLTSNSKYKKLIELINNRLKKLYEQKAKQVNIQKNPSSTIEQVRQALQTLDRINAELNNVSLDLQKAMESEDIFQILDVTKRQFNYIDKILSNPNFKPSAEQLIYVSDLIDSYKVFFDKSNKDSFVNIEDYESLSDETRELYNSAINSYRNKLEASYVHNLDRKLKNYVLDIVEQYTGRREWNYEEVLPDINMISKYTLSVDRTNEDILGVYSRIKSENNVEIRENIAKKLLHLDEVAKKAIPYLTRLMKPNNKFGIHEPFINDDGTLVLDLTQSFMDERRLKEKEWRETNEQYKLGLINQKKYEKAKKDWRDYVRNIYVSLDPRVYFEGYSPLYTSVKSQTQKDALRQRDLAKLGQATLDYELEKMKTHIENFERDYAAQQLYLTEKYSNEDGSISAENKKLLNKELEEFVYTNHPVHIYEFFNEFDSTSKINLEYSNKNFNYTTNTVKRTSWETGKDTGYYNPKMDTIRNNPDLLAYYNEIKEIFRFGRSILPEYMQENLRLSDIPFMEKELLIGNIKQLVTERKSFMSRLWTKIVSTLIEKRPEQIDDIPDDQVSTSFIRKNAVDVNDLLEKKIVEYYLKLDITPDQINNYKKEYVLLKKNPKIDLNMYSYYRVRNTLRKEIIAEQNEYKSFDLLKIAKAYYAGAMNYHQKFNTVDNLALVKELGEKKFNDPDKNELREAGIKILNKNTTAPNKADILDKDFRFYRGYSNRTPQNPLKNLKKRYNVLEKFIKEKTENALNAIETKLATYSDVENLSEQDRAAYESLLALRNQYLDDIDKLGGYIYFSNVVRAYNKLLAFVQLGFNVGSFIPNMLYGTFNNAYEVADGRIINQESYSKVFREMYYRSDKTKMTALALGAVAGNILVPFYGTFIGGALAYQLGKLAPKSSISEKIFKFMDSRDVYQKIQDEVNKETTKSGAESSMLDKAFIFTSESEALHQGTLAGSLLENTKVKLDSGEIKSLLDLMDVNGNVPNIIVENPKIPGETIELPKLLNEATVAIVAYISRTHGNYRNDFRQMYKDNDYLATLGTFRGWLWESYATRYENESTDWLIGSQKNTTKVKGSYRSVMENSGIWGVLAGLGGSSMTKSIIISAITGSPWGMLIGAGISTAGLGYTLHKADLLKDALAQGKSDINKNFLKSIVNKSLQVPFRSKKIEWFKGAEDNLANNLSEIDAANYRKVIQELTFGIWLFGVYSTLLIAKAMGGDDDDRDEVVKRLENYALNTTGRLMLDLNAYSSSSDFYSKVSTIEKMIPVVNMANTHYKLISNLMTLAEYERKTGMFEKGELKYKKYLLESLPLIRPIYNQYRYNEQEFSLFKEANK